MGEITITVKECVFEDCLLTVGEADYCGGCDRYICRTHRTNLGPINLQHEMSAHWTDSLILIDELTGNHE